MGPPDGWPATTEDGTHLNDPGRNQVHNIECRHRHLDRYTFTGFMAFLLVTTGDPTSRDNTGTS